MGRLAGGVGLAAARASAAGGYPGLDLRKVLIDVPADGFTGPLRANRSAGFGILSHQPLETARTCRPAL